MPVSNPFLVTKAVDFTDAEIASTWVSWPGGSGASVDGAAEMTGVAGTMPRFLVGGKGGGRTHAMRFVSFELQQFRHRDVWEGVLEDGYIGIYFRCGGLNANRFSGKGQSADTWSAVFAYYMDVWLARLANDVLSKLHRHSKWSADDIDAYATRVADRADLPVWPGPGPVSFANVHNSLQSLLRQMDRAINNAAITRKLLIDVRGRPGELVFSLPEVAADVLPGLADLRFSYLIDEFENLTEDQQVYVNTLVREKRLPTNFVVGSRRSGLRTMRTFSAGEENVKGSEFDLVVLEDSYRNNAAEYEQFCQDIIRTRLVRGGFPQDKIGNLESFFERHLASGDPLRGDAARKVVGDGPSQHLKKLGQKLAAAGVPRSDSDEYIRAVTFPGNPLVEKFALLRFYQNWAKRKSMEDCSRLARADAASVLAERHRSPLWNVWMQRREDMFSQLLVEHGYPVEYAGIDCFIELSGFLPRNLLVILKQTLKWAEFRGIRPFITDELIDSVSQREGVREAAAWFLEDAKELGSLGENADVAVRRLGGFLRRMRFSDKPVEVSCCAFSTDRRGVSRQALDVLDSCVRSSLLVQRGEGTMARNSGALHFDYQIHPMLVSMFDLPVARRGVAALAADELNSIFDPGVSDAAFDSATSRRLAGMNAPFNKGGGLIDDAQGVLI